MDQQDVVSVEAPTRQEVELRWEGVLDAQGHVRRCPVCGCRELFVRKDFPQGLGLLLVMFSAATVLVLFAVGYVLWGWCVLIGLAVIDAVIWFAVGRCLVCYRCRSEFRDVSIPSDQPGWDLAIGEKYRVVASPTSNGSTTQVHQEGKLTSDG